MRNSDTRPFSYDSLVGTTERRSPQTNSATPKGSKEVGLQTLGVGRVQLAAYWDPIQNSCRDFLVTWGLSLRNPLQIIQKYLNVGHLI